MLSVYITERIESTTLAIPARRSFEAIYSAHDQAARICVARYITQEQYMAPDSMRN